MTPKITSAGLQLTMRALYDSEGVSLQFSKIKYGNGECPANYRALTDLQNPVLALDPVIDDSYEDYVILRADTSDAEIDDNFLNTEVGIFVTDPDGGDDILYAYAHYQLTDDNAAMPIKPDATGLLSYRDLIHVFVGDIEDVSAVISDSSATVTKSQFLAHTQARNPHGTNAADVGLGNVPNVTTDDQQPTVTLPLTLTEISNGDLLSTIVSKAALAVKKLISHLADNVKHITAAERTAWNGKANSTHNHSASDVNTGVLSVRRGGTGIGTWETNRMIFPSAAGQLSQMDFPTAAGMVLQQGTYGAPFWGYPVASEAGSYTGTNQNGSSHPNSIAFKALPKIVFIMQIGKYRRWGILFPAAGRGFSEYDGVRSDLVVSTSGKTVSWYLNSEGGAANQLNAMFTHYYVGIF